MFLEEKQNNFNDLIQMDVNLGQFFQSMISLYSALVLVRGLSLCQDLPFDSFIAITYR